MLNAESAKLRAEQYTIGETARNVVAGALLRVQAETLEWAMYRRDNVLQKHAKATRAELEKVKDA